VSIPTYVIQKSETRLAMGTGMGPGPAPRQFWRKQLSRVPRGQRMAAPVSEFGAGLAGVTIDGATIAGE